MLPPAVCHATAIEIGYLSETSATDHFVHRELPLYKAERQTVGERHKTKMKPPMC